MSGERHCGRCHTCGTPLKRVLDGEQWCPHCGTYRRYNSHGWCGEKGSRHCPPLPVLDRGRLYATTWDTMEGAAWHRVIVYRDGDWWQWEVTWAGGAALIEPEPEEWERDADTALARGLQAAGIMTDEQIVAGGFLSPRATVPDDEFGF